MNRKICQECNDYLAVKDEKYCVRCRRSLIKKMEEDGYLTDAKNGGTFSDERGRKNSISSRTIGGCAEMNTDGDD